MINGSYQFQTGYGEDRPVQQNRLRSCSVNEYVRVLEEGKRWKDRNGKKDVLRSGSKTNDWFLS